MSNKRKLDVDLGRVNLQNLSDDSFKSVVESTLNKLLAIVADRSVVIPSLARDPDPEHGDFLVEDNGSVHVAYAGEYHQIHPVESPVSKGVGAGEMYDLIFPNPARVVKWAAFEGEYSTATNQTQLIIDSVAAKRIAIVWLGVNNANTATDQLVYFQHEDLGVNLLKMSVPKGGGTVVHNFIGSPIIGTAIAKKFNIVIAEDLSDTANVRATVGYVEIDDDFATFVENPTRREQGNTSEPY